VERQYEQDQESLRNDLADVFAREPLDHWLRLFGDEDVCVGPVSTPEEAAADFGSAPSGVAPALGAHTDAWRRELEG
jgi:crotonobetainyl-CoA:carnitine CoA-transferase CaiB-like acyl-CoA transferase